MYHTFVIDLPVTVWNDWDRVSGEEVRTYASPLKVAVVTGIRTKIAVAGKVSLVPTRVRHLMSAIGFLNS